MPRLPNADRVIIDPRKITDYLLSPTHRHGASKSQFFYRFGFNRAKPKTLATALRWHARSHDAFEDAATPFGITYHVDGSLQSPDGRNPNVRVVWMIRHGEVRPRLVTVIPLEPLRP
jgi:hypothetical protein